MHDTPERVFERKATVPASWLSSSGGENASTPRIAYLLSYSGNLYSGHWSNELSRTQRPVLCLNNQ